MRELEDRYISLLTDFGFKRIFGTAPNKELLICFLNSLFDGTQVIRDVKYLNNEHLGDSSLDRKAIFDVYCEGENGEKFIVEMQNAYQEFFKDRSLFYTTFPIREQAEKGSEWDFRLTHVYTVALLNFDMHEDSFDADDICHTVKLCDVKTNKVFYRKLDFIYVEIAKFTPRELREYEDSRKAYRDLKNSLDTAKREGIAEGMEKGRAEERRKSLAEKREIALQLLATGMPAEQVSAIVGLPMEELKDC